jgi:flagellar hook-associated protein 1 FlgK
LPGARSRLGVAVGFETMTSLSDIMNIAKSGLSVAQAQVTATSNNVANVNTVGYARQVVTTAESTAGGQGLGVQIASIANAANVYLEAANRSASAQASQTAAVSNFLGQAQQLFGDPSSKTSFFSGLDNVYSAFSALAASPSSLNRSTAVTAVNTFLGSATSLSNSVNGLIDQANQQASTDVSQINGLLAQIAQANTDIAGLSTAGGDVSGVQNTQSQLLNQLSGLMQVQVSKSNNGVITLRSQDGVYLVGTQGPATLNYSKVGGGALLTATAPQGQPAQITAGTGEVAGLMQLAGVQLPQLSTELGQFVSQAVGQINAAYNNTTAVPPPNIVTGTPTGMSLPTAIGNFSGDTTIAITNAAGVMQQRVDINFAYGVGQMTVTSNGGGTSTINFNPTNFLASLNTALGAEGSASYVNGVLSIGANTSTNGVAITDNPTSPSSNSGIGFSRFFGLNNLVQSSSYANVSGSLNAGSPNTFSTGGSMNLALTDANGAMLRQVNLTIPASAATVGDVINSLNASVGGYGAFNLDPQGHLAFTPSKSYTGASVSVMSDNTINTAGGPPLSQMLGIGWNTQAAMTSSFSVRGDIAANPSSLATAELDLTQTVNGASALGVGDGSGAQAIADSGSNNITFSTAGAINSGTMSVSTYGSQLAGLISSTATDASDASKSATALQTQAASQLSSAEGVNLDTELVNLTNYQQSYNACARLIQASQTMYTTLMQMVQ